MKTNIHAMTAMREGAVNMVMSVLRNASDWQEAQDALANDVRYGPWLRGRFGADAISEAQSIIREAEERLGDDLPY